MKTSFDIAGKTVTVVRRVTGVEEYYVNDKLVLKERCDDCQVERNLAVGDREVVFKYEFCDPVEYYCQVLVDGKVYIRDIFPGVVISKRITKRLGKKVWIIHIAVLVFVIWFIYQITKL